MIVRELIEELSRVHPNAKVVIDRYEGIYMDVDVERVEVDGEIVRIW